MAVLSYKEFMEKVRMRLRNLSTEDFQNLILNWASEEHPSMRQEFLDKLIPTKQKKEVISNVDTLMDEIEAFAQRVKFFLQARSLLLQGKYKLAEEVYRKLFDILEMGQEPGHLPGDPE